MPNVAERTLDWREVAVGEQPRAMLDAFYPALDRLLDPAESDRLVARIQAWRRV